MKRSVLLFVCLFVCWAVSDQCFRLFQNKTELREPKRVYFTTWDIQAPVRSKILNPLVNKFMKSNKNVSIVPFSPNFDAEQPMNKGDIYLVVWYHFDLPPIEYKNQSYIWLLETPIQIQIPPKEEYVRHFKKIFTWHKPSANQKNIIYVPIPYAYENIIRDYNISKKTHLISHVGKYQEEHNYKLRAQSIAWYLENHPSDIRFFGTGWKNIVSSLSEPAKESFKTQYGGYLKNKIEEIAKAKFVFAFENKRFEDYVSEKIYDVMAAGSVPIYSGAPNITDYVPKACFIDFHNFDSYDELHTFLTNMTDKEYNSYLKCIKNFMENPEKQENHYLNVAETVYNHIEGKKDFLSSVIFYLKSLIPHQRGL